MSCLRSLSVSASLAVFVLASGCPKGSGSGGAEGGSSGGAPASPPVVYAWQATEAQAQPELLGSLMKDFYNLHLLLSVSRQEGSATVVVASAVDGQQDPCAETSTLTVPVGPDGAFAAQAPAITFAAASLQASLYQAQVQGNLAPQSLQLDVSGLVDTREFLPLLGSGEDGALCEMMPAMGPCVPCPDQAPYCWSISLKGAQAVPTDAAVAARSLQEACAEPSCAARCPASEPEEFTPAPEMEP